MICPPCRKAGTLNSLAGSIDRDTPNVEKMVRAMHNDCPGGNWCDCQHVVGQALNLPLIRALESAERIEGINAVTV